MGISAGCTDFGDSDDAWDRDFTDVVARVLDSLTRLGTAVLREGQYPIDRGRARVSVRDALIAAARDDNFPPCVVVFGDPPRASVRTSDGHAILWIWLAGDADMDTFVGELAGGGEIANRTMNWQKLGASR